MLHDLVALVDQRSQSTLRLIRQAIPGKNIGTFLIDAWSEHRTETGHQLTLCTPSIWGRLPTSYPQLVREEEHQKPILTDEC